MKNNKLKVYSRLEIVLAIISIVVSGVYFLLCELGAVKLSNESGGLGHAIELIVGAISFIFFLVGEAFTCVYMIAEALMLGDSRFPRRALLFGAIVKLLFTAGAVFEAYLLFETGIVFGGIIAVFFSLVLFTTGIFGLSVSKIKTEPEE